MALPQPLRNPPITEALIDIRVKARRDFDPAEFSSLKTTLSRSLPSAQEHRGRETTIEIRPDATIAPSTKDLGLQGFFFRSADELTIAQFRTDGFTLNRLRPYTSWGELLPMGQQLWRIYVSVARPEAIARLALRYINHIALPPAQIDLDDYMTTAPKIPPDLPQYLGGFLTKILLQDPVSGLAANISQSLDLNALERLATVILDIDAHKTVEYSPDDSRITETLQQLHDFKNQIFFSSVTDKTLELFK